MKAFSTLAFKVMGAVLIKVVVISCKVKRKNWSWNLTENKLWLSWFIFKSFSRISFLVYCLYFPTLRGWNVCIVSSITVVSSLQQLRDVGSTALSSYSSPLPHWLTSYTSPGVGLFFVLFCWKLDILLACHFQILGRLLFLGLWPPACSF